MSELDSLLEDYRLTTAEIFYHLPDHPDSLQSYVWQSLDRVPDFPKLNQFLDFWENQLDGKLHSVKVAYVGEVEASDWQYENCILTVH